MGLFGPPNVEKLGEKGDVEGLIKALSYRDVRVARDAASALGRIATPRAIEALLGVVRARTPSLWDSVVYDLAFTRSSQAIDGLIAEFASRDGSTFYHAIKSIGWSARDELRRAIQSPDLQTRKYAAILLGMLGDPEGVALIRLNLRDADSTIREDSAIVLGKLADPAATDILLGFLESEGHYFGTRVQAAEALGIIGDPRAALPLARRATPKLYGVSDEYIKLQATCAQALLGMGKSAVTPLVQTLYNPKGQDRKQAANGLELIGWTPGLDCDGMAYWIAKENWSKAAAYSAETAGQFLSEIVKKSGNDDAINAMADAGWKPGRDWASAKYWIARREYQKCSETGAYAVAFIVAAIREAEKYLAYLDEEWRKWQDGLHHIDRYIIVDGRTYGSDVYTKRDVLEKKSSMVVGQESEFKRSTYYPLIHAVRQIRDPEAAELLAPLLADPNRDVAKAAAEAIAGAGHRLVSDADQERLLALLKEIKADSASKPLPPPTPAAEGSVPYPDDW